MYFWNARFARMLTLAAAGALALSAAGADSSLQAVFARIDQAAAKFKGMTAEVRRLSHEGVINEEEVDTGTIAVKLSRPHDIHMLIDFKQPDPKSVEVAGTKVSIYYPKAAEVQEYNFGKAHRAQVEQFLKLGFGSTSRDLEEAYTVRLGGREKIGGEETTRLDLTPKSPDLAAQFPKFELWISDELGIAIQQKMYQAGGSYNIATYSNVQLNPNLPDAAVKLILPKGVKMTALTR